MLYTTFKLSRLSQEQSRALWRDIRDAACLAPRDERVVWRISTAPAQGAAVAAAIVAEADAELFYDWAGGLIWVALPPGKDAAAPVVRGAVTAAGGHATLVRAPPALRAAVEVVHPQDAVLASLSKRVKESFDPKGILNPGRMWAGV
jgi:glycolate oxidase FAD binding subunit